MLSLRLPPSSALRPPSSLLPGGAPLVLAPQRQDRHGGLLPVHPRPLPAPRVPHQLGIPEVGRRPQALGPLRKQVEGPGPRRSVVHRLADPEGRLDPLDQGVRVVIQGTREKKTCSSQLGSEQRASSERTRCEQN